MKEMAAAKLTVKELERLLSAEFAEIVQPAKRLGHRGGVAWRLPGAPAFRSALAALGRYALRADDDGAGRFRDLRRDSWARSAGCRRR